MSSDRDQTQGRAGGGIGSGRKEDSVLSPLACRSPGTAESEQRAAGRDCKVPTTRLVVARFAGLGFQAAKEVSGSSRVAAAEEPDDRRALVPVSASAVTPR